MGGKGKSAYRGRQREARDFSSKDDLAKSFFFLPPTKLKYVQEFFQGLLKMCIVNQ